MALTNMDALTRSSSLVSSLTTENSEHKSNREQCECVSRADEMHDQYLNRLEASFVTQLHRSTSWLARWPNMSMKRNLSMNRPDKKTSEQFTVFWEKINFERATTTDSHDVFKNPWAEHFKHGDKPCSTGPPDVDECRKNHHENLLRDPRTYAHKFGTYSSDMFVNETRFTTVGSTSEGSGQNFFHEDCNNEATFRVKKLKLSAADTSCADQIVPSSENGAEIHPLVGKIPAEDQGRNQSLSEYRNVGVPEPVFQCFHRFQ
ncbi:hypothetical protein Leryth_011557 [Lithospermum erythrorhizon]|nr:hypothetical protein Leryth_011557 [Lithospermum erythrorhizon]